MSGGVFLPQSSATARIFYERLDKEETVSKSDNLSNFIPVSIEKEIDMIAQIEKVAQTVVSLESIKHVHVSRKEEGKQNKCAICAKDVVSYALAYFEKTSVNGKTQEIAQVVFHNCCFYQLKNEQQIGSSPFFLYYLFPNFCVRYPKTKENVLKVANQVTEIYAFFWKKEAHKGSLHEQLEFVGVQIEPWKGNFSSISSEKIQQFSKGLAAYIQEKIESNSIVEFEKMYGFKDDSPLCQIANKIGINLELCGSLFPRHTKLSILEKSHDCKITKEECIAAKNHLNEIEVTGIFSIGNPVHSLSLPYSVFSSKFFA